MSYGLCTYTESSDLRLAGGTILMYCACICGTGAQGPRALDGLSNASILCMVLVDSDPHPSILSHWPVANAQQMSAVYPP